MAAEPTRTFDDPATRTAADDDSKTGGTTVIADGPGRAGPPRTERYLLGDEIARGGMGEVYTATDTCLHRAVAVKVLQARLAGTLAERRFQDEARITGQLQHPAIPPVYDLGTLPDGRPYLAMKLIRGRTLDALLKADGPGGHWLPVFEGLCQAVGYAHAHGVIHRDLKPANVMVGAFGEVQVMDWGLARVCDPRPVAAGTAAPPAAPDPLAETLTALHAFGPDGPLDDRTAAGAVLGTPAFMPPEQARGEISRVDRRSDVFGLGAVLCALLTGKAPFTATDGLSTLKAAAAGEVRAVFDRLAGCGADPDLIALCKRCLAPDPPGRPADAGEVATAVAALRRAADDRAKRAAADLVAAAARAAEGQNRRRVVRRAAAAVSTVLLAGTAVSTWQAGRAWRAEGVAVDREHKEQAARRVADAKSQAATAAKEFLQRVLVQADVEGQATKDRPADPDRKLRDALDYAAKEIAGKFTEQPEIDADLRDTIGRAYMGLGDYVAARAPLAEALRLRESALGTDHGDTLASTHVLAAQHLAVGEFEAAEGLFRRALAGYERTLGPDHRATLSSLEELAITLQNGGNLTAAEPLLRKALAGCDRALGADDPGTLTCANNLALLMEEKGNNAEAETLYRRALAGREKVRGPIHPDTLDSVNGLASVLQARGETTAAEALHRRALDGREKALGPDHPNTLQSANNLATLYKGIKNWTAAEPLYRRALTGAEKSLGPGHPNTLVYVSNLAALLQARGGGGAAEPLFRRALAGAEVTFGPDHPDTLESAGDLGGLFQARGDPAAAEPFCRRAAEGAEKLKFDFANAPKLVGRYVRCLADLGRPDRAAEWQRKKLTVVAARAGPASPPAAAETWELGRLELLARQYAAAEMTLRKCLAVCEKLAAEQSPTIAAWQVAHTRSLLGGALFHQDKFAEAEPALLDGYRRLAAESVPEAGRQTLPDAADRLIRFYEAVARPGDAARWRAERAKYARELAPLPRPAK